jgi:cytochrome P450 family 6
MLTCSFDSASTGDKQKFTLEQATAQAFLFFFAGYETSSSTMQFAAYELALNPKVQDKLREEVNRVIKKHNGTITYEAIQEMTYLEQVFDGKYDKLYTV